MNMVIDQIIRDFLQYLNSATDIEKAKQTVNITLYELNVNRIEEIKMQFFLLDRENCG